MKKTLLLASLVCACVLGCARSSDETAPPAASDSHGTDSHGDSAHDHSRHAHPSHGPHGGELIELGQEDYHVELVHGDAGLSLHVLDGEAKTAVPIDAQSLTISLKKDGAVKSFDLASERLESDAEGKSSHFASADEELHEWLDGGAEGAITIEIDGKSFTGNVAHDHDHDH